MKLFGKWSFAPLALGLVLTAVGCAKAKSALEDAAGIAPLSGDEINAIKTEVGWPANPDEKTPSGKAYANLSILGGVKLTDKFSQDLSGTTSLGPIPVDVPNAGKDKAGQIKSMMLVKELQIDIDATTHYKRLQIISVARYDSDKKSIDIDGAAVNKFIDPTQVVSKANGNQAGSYLLIEAAGDKGIQYLTGIVSLKLAAAGSTAAPVDKTLVFTTTSPFVTITGTTGQFLLATIQDSKGAAIGYKHDIATVGTGNPAAAATGTPVTTTTQVTYTGVLDQYKGQVDDKTSAIDDPAAKTAINDNFTKANTLVTDFLNAWKVTTINMVFIQPPQAAPTPNPPNTPPPVAPISAPVVQPTPPVVPATPPAPDPVVERRDPTQPDTDPYNVDLGCNGFDDSPKGANAVLPVVFDGTKMDNYDTSAGGVHGWRAQGDVRIAFDFADIIFPTPAGAAHYLDPAAGKGNGYCLLTTGDQLYQINAKQAQYNPGPDGGGQVSEMWQKVHVPADAKSIQVRVAFFSQEFPKFVGSQYNDSFFVKFDESPDVIAAGNLNDLAGANSPDQTIKDAVSTCHTNVDGKDLTKTCGDWGFVANYKTPDGKGTLPHGQLWGIENSTQAPAHGDNYGCVPAGAATKKCFHGMIAPRIICKNIAPEEAAQLRTLRFHVEDAGDKYFDSALAVDSVVFSKDDCSNKDGRMTPEPDSRATELGN